MSTLFIFIDESGDFNYSNTGTNHYILSAVSVGRPFPNELLGLLDLKHECWEQGHEFEYFHAAEDKQTVRDSVFGVISNCIGSIRCDSVIAEKRKTNPSLQKDQGQFYTTLMRSLLQHVLDHQKTRYNEVIIVADAPPVNKKRNAFEKGMKAMLAGWARQHGAHYRIHFCESKSEPLLQVADYINWAIFRKWERNDLRSYEKIKKCIKTESEIFAGESERYY